MNTCKIKEIFDSKDLFKLSEQLFEKIKLSYGLNEPQDGFTGYFINVLKKYHPEITFEQIESAFEYNASGYLNDYLPKSGYSVDNKVKFTIPDLTKIIKAYQKYKNLDQVENKESFEKTPQEIAEIHKQWTSQLITIFNKYMNDFEKTSITLPFYTCNYLAKLGLIDSNKIDRKEKKVQIKIGKNKFVKSTHNEDLIYNCFDEILQGGQTLDVFLASSMPFNYSSGIEPDF